MDRPMDTAEVVHAMKVIEARSRFNRNASGEKVPTTFDDDVDIRQRRKLRPCDRVGLASAPLGCNMGSAPSGTPTTDRHASGARYVSAVERAFFAWMWSVHGYEVPVPPPSNKGQLWDHKDEWQRRFPRNPFTEIISRGALFEAEFIAVPRQDGPRPSCKLTPDEWKHANVSVQDWVSKGYVSCLGRMQDQSVFGTDGYIYSGIVVVAKKSRDGTLKKRGCLGATLPNTFIRKYPHHKMESSREAKMVMQPWDVMFTADAREYYMMASLGPMTKRICRFVMKDEHGNDMAWEFQVLPFGLHPASHWMMGLKAPVIELFRSQGHRLSTIMDDDTIFSATMIQALRVAREYMSIMVALGFCFQLKKVSAFPQRVTEMHGFIFHSPSMSLLQPPYKALRERKMAWDMVREINRGRSVNAKRWASLVGTVQSSCPAKYTARLNTFWCRAQMNRVLGQRMDYANHEVVQDEHKGELLDELYRLMVSTQIWKESETGELVEVHENGMETVDRPPATIHIANDASPFGMGAWVMETNDRFAQEYSQEMSAETSNRREADADRESVEAVVVHRGLWDCWIAILTDNMTSLSYMRKQGGRVYEIAEPMVRLLLWLYHRYLIKAWSAHIPGMINTQADDQSRLDDDTREYKLAERVQEKVFQALGQPDLDCMATKSNVITGVRAFISGTLDARSSAIDFLTPAEAVQQLVAQAVLPYIFPPQEPMMIHRALRVAVQLKVKRFLFVAPIWPGQSWWPIMTRMMVDYPYIMARSGAIVPPTNQKRKRSGYRPRWRTAVFVLSASRPRCRAFRRRLAKLHSGGTKAERQEFTTTITGFHGDGTATSLESRIRILTSIM